MPTGSGIVRWPNVFWVKTIYSVGIDYMNGVFHVENASRIILGDRKPDIKSELLQWGGGC